MADKPYPIKLGKLKELLYVDAVEQDRSIAYLIRKIIREYYEKKGKKV